MFKVTNSLFNYLDKNLSNSVTFDELVKRIYPDITLENIAMMKRTIKRKQDILHMDNPKFNLGLGNIISDKAKEKRVDKVLSKRYMKRMFEIFLLFDRDLKGFVTLADITRHFDTHSDKDIENLFAKYDSDHDGKMSFEEFSKFILPRGYTIDEEDDVEIE